jgi:apolipoprotein N-acyltransferase
MNKTAKDDKFLRRVLAANEDTASRLMYSQGVTAGLYSMLTQKPALAVLLVATVLVAVSAVLSLVWLASSKIPRNIIVTVAVLLTVILLSLWGIHANS